MRFFVDFLCSDSARKGEATINLRYWKFWSSEIETCGNPREKSSAHQRRFVHCTFLIYTLVSIQDGMWFTKAILFFFF